MRSHLGTILPDYFVSFFFNYSQTSKEKHNVGKQWWWEVGDGKGKGRLVDRENPSDQGISKEKEGARHTGDGDLCMETCNAQNADPLAEDTIMEGIVVTEQKRRLNKEVIFGNSNREDMQTERIKAGSVYQSRQNQ